MDSLFVDLIHLCQRYIYLFQILIFNAYLSNWFSYLYSEINYMRLYNLTYFIYILELRQILSQYTHCSYLNCHFFPRKMMLQVYKGKDVKGLHPEEEVEVLRNPLSGEGNQIILRFKECSWAKMMTMTMMMRWRD